MPMERMSMRRVRDCLRLKSAGISTREIARRLGVASSTVRLTLCRCEAAEVTWPLAPDMSDAVLEERLFASSGTKQGHRRHAEPDWSEIHRELKRKHVTLAMLWNEYIERRPDPSPQYPRPALLSLGDNGLLKHPTLDQLHALGLYGMAKAFAELAETLEAKDIDRHDWLALLLDREASWRRDKRLTARLRAAKLRQHPQRHSTRRSCLAGLGDRLDFCRHHPSGRDGPGLAAPYVRRGLR